MSTPMLPIRKETTLLIETTAQKNKTRRKLICLAQSHIYGVFILQILIFALLIAFTLWLFIRLPEPEVTVTSFRVDGLNDSLTTTMLHYQISLHNPDMYKSVKYDVLVMRIIYSEYYEVFRGLVDFNQDGNAKHQGRGDTTPLPSNGIDFTSEGMGWNPVHMSRLKTLKSFISLRLVMQFTCLGYTRQRMRVADIYFDDNGNAFIAPGGQKFK